MGYDLAVLTILLYRCPHFPSCTTLGGSPKPYYRKRVESIVGALSFPDTLTVSCIALAVRYLTKRARPSGNNHYCLSRRAAVDVRDCVSLFSQTAGFKASE